MATTKSPSKKSPVKKPAARKKPTKAKSVPVRSLRRSASDPFLTFRISQQTLYWLVLSLVVLALGVWVISINVRVQAIYDQIDKVSYENSTPVYVNHPARNR